MFRSADQTSNVSVYVISPAETTGPLTVVASMPGLHESATGFDFKTPSYGMPGRVTLAGETHEGARHIAAMSELVHNALKKAGYGDVAERFYVEAGAAHVADCPFHELVDSQIEAFDEFRPVMIGYLVNQGYDPEKAEERVAGAVFKAIRAIIERGQLPFAPRGWIFEILDNHNRDENERENCCVNLDSEAAIRLEARGPTSHEQVVKNEEDQDYKTREEKLRASLDEDNDQDAIVLLKLRERDFWTRKEIREATQWTDHKTNAVLKRLRRKAEELGVVIPPLRRPKKS